MTNRLWRFIPAAALVLFLTATARAELTPDNVAILGMAASEQSRQLADYYAEARGIPKSNILLLEGQVGKTLPREAWGQQIRPAIRQWLSQDGRKERIRCLVTVWDVPLKIGPRDGQSPETVARREFLTQVRTLLVGQVLGQMKTLDELAPGEQTPERPALDQQTDLKTLAAQFESALQAARDRLRGLESEEERKQAGNVLERAFLAGAGISGVVRMLDRQAAAAGLKPKAVGRIEQFKGRLQGLGEGLQAVSTLRDTVSRDELMLNMLRKSAGLIGTLQWIEQQEKELRKNETAASFDSELSLVYWPDYLLLRWQPNQLQHRYRELPALHRPTLMVARLEAPTFELAKNLIDTAISVEKTGLQGKVYLDARGMRFDPDKDKPGSYGQYDQSLRDLARRLEEHTELEVVINNEATLFQPGDCPEAALYCGWYSLARYIDAFDWQSGAIGYHLASSEATTLRTPGGKAWCNAMLEDGIGATLGPTFEPYLASFPLPDDFFSLLLTGRHTLVEVYYRTKPHNSWAMVLVGDPLYNPFKNNPQLSEDALPQRLKRP